eukprot:CAMPEP_0206381268 /NCGR_PEP_ID=MMETSP0294-20121207/12545_1 /ASSEMBLY_ACC=CAM_ASM_000327 /TAXON_ID=39354 /ORGANISM="Heterosigma akashiwo, Strain CCMP2393" /LENGTH=94 /DNA_ID=CAMNT_0053830689 /DNA_START=1010 /DNA_END=1294 /DNA_ORIENTATION=+
MSYGPSCAQEGGLLLDQNKRQWTHMRKHHSQHDQKSVLPLPFLQQPHRPEGVFFEEVFCFFEAEEDSFSSATLGGGLGGGELFTAGPETTRPLR